jgi:Ran GTPase-activating protein (RanGAP) involved in mRNA processing and transport
LFNPLEPRLALALSNTSPEFRRPSPNGARAPTQEARWQLRAQHEAAAALCHKVGMRGCKELRKAASAYWHNKGLSAADLERLGTLGSVLPALKVLSLSGNAADPDGVRRLAEGLGAGDLPALTHLILSDTQMGDAGAAALAAALSRGALPRIEVLAARDNGIGDAGLLALAPALRQRPTLEGLSLAGNPLGDEGLAALVALPPKTGALARLWRLDLDRSQIGNAGGAALAAALERGIMPALEKLLFSSDAAAAATHAHVKASPYHYLLPHSTAKCFI